MTALMAFWSKVQSDLRDGNHKDLNKEKISLKDQMPKEKSRHIFLSIYWGRGF